MFSAAPRSFFSHMNFLFKVHACSAAKMKSYQREERIILREKMSVVQCVSVLICQSILLENIEDFLELNFLINKNSHKYFFC